MIFDIVAGWTGPLDFQLKADNIPVNLTGMTVALILKNAAGSAVDTSGKTSILEAATGKVRYMPAAVDLNDASGPYAAHWKVTDGSSRDVFFPSRKADEWRVYRP